MKARPILFNGDMVRALLAGRKTMTRRLVDPQPRTTRARGWYADWYNKGARMAFWLGLKMSEPRTWRCPFGVPGDLLWVRETFADTLGMGFDDRIHFAADTQPGSDADEIRKAYGVKWKPSIHMPRWASRLTLRVTDVRVERVQDISEEDAECEGVEPATPPEATGATHRGAFRDLWNTINGPDAWDRNDWVWVVGFEVVRANVDSVRETVDG